ncbi:hypothetical protein MKX03_028994 [Papaver bracteatum]|nr:hypothetical protein MKX03_028994 [Papaver bracteatum]
MSTRAHIPSQATSQFVQQRARVVVSPPPPPPPSSQTEFRESMKRKRTSWVWDHFERSVDEVGITWGKCNYCEGGRYKVGGKEYGTSNLKWHLTKCQKYLDTQLGQQSLGHPTTYGWGYIFSRSM